MAIKITDRIVSVTRRGFLSRTAGAIAASGAAILPLGEVQAKMPELEQMAQAGEISVDQATGKLPPGSVLIDPDQDVLATSEVVITVKIVPVGVARTIVVNIGFVPKIA